MLPARLGSLLTREPLIAQTRRSRCTSAAVSTRPSQYAAKAFSFSVTQAKTSCASVGESWPVTNPRDRPDGYDCRVGYRHPVAVGHVDLDPRHHGGRHHAATPGPSSVARSSLDCRAARTDRVCHPKPGDRAKALAHSDALARAPGYGASAERRGLHPCVGRGLAPWSRTEIGRSKPFNASAAALFSRKS